LIVGPVFSVFLSWLLPRTFHLLNSDPEVISQALPYLDARIMAITFVGMNFAFRGYWNALDMSRIYMSTLVVMHISNIFLNWVLIFGHLGAPAMGVKGAGMASAIAMVIGTATYMILGMKYAREHGFLKEWGTRLEIKNLVRLSVPAGIQQLFFSAGFVAMYWIIGKVGTLELAAANVLINIMLVALLPGLGLGLACSTLVGQAIGRGHPDDAYQWGWDVAKVAAVVMTTLGLPMLLTPDLVTMHFLHDPVTQDLARWPMRLVGMWMPVEALGFIMMHALYGAGDARRVMKISIVFQWGLFLPAAYFIGPVLGFGLLGIWLMQGGYRILQSLTFMRYWRAGAWRDLVV
jgi:putative MATE family efflux protein